MYTLWVKNTTIANSEEICFYNDQSTFEEFKISEARLSLGEGTAGTLKIKVPKTNVAYSEFELMASQVVIRKNGVVYWVGRLLSSSENFYGTLDLNFEGIYNYSMDTIQLQKHYEGSLVGWVNTLLIEHNKICIARGEYYKIIRQGTLDQTWSVSGNTDLYSDYETTQECLGNVIEGWKGHPRFTYQEGCTSYTYQENGVTHTVNYSEPCINIVYSVYKDYETLGNDAIPKITFGENLMDYGRENNVDELATVIIPRGQKYTDEETAAVEATIPPASGVTQLEPYKHIDGLDYYRTIYSVTNPQTIYLATTDTTMLNKFGVICKVVDFDSCTDPSQLLTLGQRYLEDQKWVAVTLTIKAIDAQLLGADTSEIKIGRNVECISKPHGLDHMYPCTEIEEDMMDPSQTVYTLGLKDESYLTDSSRKTDDKLRDLVLANRRREAVIEQNTLNDISNAFNDETVYSASEFYNTIVGDIQVGMGAAEDAATLISKGNIINLLNIFDNDLNRNNKGYVHFVTEERDYSIDEGVLTLADLKARVNTYFPDTTTYSSYKLSDFWTHLETYMDDENYMVVVLLGSNLYETAIGIFGLTQGTVDGHKVPYYNTPSDTRYTSPAKYFINGNSNSYYIHRGGFKSKSGSSCRFSCATSGQFFYSSNTSICNKASPAISSMNNTIPGDILPNDLTFNSNNYTVYCNRDIYTDNLQSIWRNKNFYKSLTPNPKEHITEIVISDDLDYTQSTSGVWRWNKLGLYFLENGYSTEYCDDRNGEYSKNNNTVRVGITRDGQIVADLITVGRLDAGIVRTGYLLSQDYDSSDPDGWKKASFILDVDHGTMTGRQGRFIFNGDNMEGSALTARTTRNDFLYMSNEPIGALFNIAGHTANDWMFILGSSFGIDQYGRAYMREGIIGATGGIWDCAAYNDGYITTRWILQEGQTTQSHLVYTLHLNTTCARPVIKPAYRNDKRFNFWYRLARYNGDTLVFLSEPSDNIFFEAGNEPIKFTGVDFNPPITYPGTVAQAEENSPAFYAGEVFPVFYTLNDQTTSEEAYTYNGHKYVPHTFPDKLKIGSYLNNDSDYPQYINYSNRDLVNDTSVIDIDSSGAVCVGSGYIYNNSIGTNGSFSLSGINRSATMTVPDGLGNSTTTRDDWRLTIGSKFAVTDDGTLHCAGAYLRNAIIDTTVSASKVNTNNVGGVLLNTDQPIDGSLYTYTLSATANWYGSNTAYLRMWLSSASYVYNSVETDILPEPNSGPPDYIPTSAASKIPQTYFYGDIRFKISIYANFIAYGGSTESQLKCEKEFTYLKSSETGYTGAVDYQMFELGSVEHWTDYMDDGSPSVDWDFTYYGIYVEMLNERSGSSRPTWRMSGSAFPVSSSETNFSGTMSVERMNADSTRVCMDVGGRDIVSSGKWLGGPYKYWSHAYITDVHYKTLSNDSSRIYKNTIEPLDEIYDKIFDELRPVSYYFNDDYHKVKHTGFIMEELGEILEKNNIDSSLFGGYVPNENGEPGGGINYIDFIAILTRQVQKLKRRVRQLEERCKVEKDENSSDFEASE